LPELWASACRAGIAAAAIAAAPVTAAPRNRARRDIMLLFTPSMTQWLHMLISS